MTYTPQPTSLYGRLIAACDVEDALKLHVDHWIDGYLNEVERQHGLDVGYIARPRAFVVASEDDRYPEDQLPAITVESAGTADRPLADGEGRYAARWEVHLGIHIAASSEALRLSKLYAVALRALAVQQVPPLYMGIDWPAERYPVTTLLGDRSIARAQVRVEAHVPDVTNRHAGPIDLDPGGDESPEWPVVATHEELIEKVPIEEEP